jgi:environmental stress-induced protein Ves
MPWKNGGGETIEIATAPEGASLENFDWRVSMAHVTADGPFSVFEDVNRTLAVIDGAGMTLAIEGRPAVTLTPASPPHEFPGDAPTSARLTDGPVADLNAMTRRGRFRHTMRRIVAPLAVEGLAVVVAWGPVTVDGLVLRRGDAVIGEALQITAATLAFVIQLSPDA